MTTLLIFFLLLFSLVLGVFRYKNACLLSMSAALVIFFVIGNGFLPSYLLHFLQTDKIPRNIDWKKNNTIVILGAGTSKMPAADKINPSFMSFSRLTIAAELYRRCKTNPVSCHILISGGDPLHNGKTEAATYRDTLIALGINATAIQLEPHSKNTFENTKFTSLLLKQQPAGQILLVDSGFSLKRALLYFSYFNIHPIPIPSDFIAIPLTKFPLGYNLAMNDFALHELIGIARFYIYNFFGWNKKSIKQIN
jgi:uncharacterized SAM-binding protein YcdF (DUF218 family)